MSWNSLPGLQLTVAAALTAGLGGLIWALRECKIEDGSRFAWLSGSGDGGGGSEKMCLIPGLQNLGNNCFLNVILQALSSCSRFQEYLNSIIEEYEVLPAGHVRSMLLLTIALADLMEELNTIRDRKFVLSPRQVMCAVQSYNTDFSLAVQQDAAEAFLHLISSLREEVSESFVPNKGSLIDASAIPRRILGPRRTADDQNEHTRWKELYLGPFDGILGNILTCRSCSFQIMMDFEFFNILPLLPVTGMGTSIFYGCSLEHCLKQYIASDEVEGYRCDYCWHIAALKYLSATNGNETDIDKLKCCGGGREKCDCRFLPSLDAIPVPISCAFKQLNIARCPKILCIQLLRATTNLFGDLIKLEGHISFPLILNLLPFTRCGVETEHVGTTSRRHANELGQPVHPLRSINKQIDIGALSHVYFPHQEEQHSETTVDTRSVSLADHANKEIIHATDEEDEHSSQIEDSPHSGAEPKNTLEQHNKQKVSNVEPHVRSISMYRLVSVVEHMGKTGGGHYTVYRRVKYHPDEESDSENIASTDRWYLMSDSNVIQVSEREVLSAQASILVYERIAES